MFKTHRTFDLSTGVKNNSIAVINKPNGLFVVYHNTIVLEKHGKTITLRNGGWDTISTRAVINRALQNCCTSIARVYRKKGQTILEKNGLVFPFVDGMKVKTWEKQS